MASKVVRISTDFITLGQLLKFAGIIDNGSQAKSFLASNKVLVNGALENRRGKKIYSDDKLTIASNEYVVVKE